MRTPLGQVLIARLHGDGAVEIAGPSAAADVRAAADAMLVHGAEQVLIDGAIDRRAASSPAIVDGLLMSTGAVLSHDLDEVVLQTKDAVDLVRLPRVDVPRRPASCCVSCQRPARATTSKARTPAPSALDAAPGAVPAAAGELPRERGSRPVALTPRFLLTSRREQIALELDANPDARWLLVAGALPDRFLRNLLHPVHHRRRELVLVVSDPTRCSCGNEAPNGIAARESTCRC